MSRCPTHSPRSRALVTPVVRQMMLVPRGWRTELRAAVDGYAFAFARMRIPAGLELMSRED